MRAVSGAVTIADALAHRESLWRHPDFDPSFFQLVELSNVSTRLAYVSTGDGKVFVFHRDSPDAYSLAQEIATRPSSKTMGYDRKTRNLIVPSSDNGAMQVLVFSPKS